MYDTNEECEHLESVTFATQSILPIQFVALFNLCELKLFCDRIMENTINNNFSCNRRSGKSIPKKLSLTFLEKRSLLDSLLIKCTHDQIKYRHKGWN